MTIRRKILFFIPLGLVVAILAFSWFTFIFADNSPVFGHYLGLIFMLPIIYFVFRNGTYKLPIILFGIYLVLCSINLFSFFPFIISNSFGLRLGTVEIWTPRLNGFSLVIFILYAVLNFDTLTDIYLDYKETKEKF